MFKKILAVLLIMVISISSQVYAAEELDSPVKLQINSERYGNGNKDGQKFFEINWINPESIIKLGNTVQYEVDFKEENGPWLSETDTKLKSNILTWDGANKTSIKFDPILENYTKNEINISKKHYSFRIRYSYSGNHGEFSTAGLAGITNFYYHASPWAVPELDKALEQELITNEIKYNMSENITRENFAGVVVGMYERSTGESVRYSDVSFIDTDKSDVLKAASLGIVMGNGYGQFEPKELVTRQDLCTMIYRAIKLLHPESDFNVSDVEKFQDENNIDKWAIEGMKYMYKHGILKGNGKGKIDPKGNATREEATILILRTYEKFK